jgi:midasin
LEEKDDLLSATGPPSIDSKEVEDPVRLISELVNGDSAKRGPQKNPEIERDKQLLLKGVDEALQALMNLFQTSGFDTDRAAQLMYAKAERTRQLLLHSDSNAPPQFLFRDGPVTRAVKRATSIFLEDLDLPSQAVTERLNSLLETTPSFSLSEDITASSAMDTIARTGSGGAHNPVTTLGARASETVMDVLPRFQLFASVHLEPGQRLNLSPAMLSRFTVIYTAPYDENELPKLLLAHFARHLSTAAEAQLACDCIFKMRSELDQENALPANDLHRLFRLADFVCRHPSEELSITDLVMRGVRFFYMDELPQEKQRRLLHSFWSKYGTSVPSSTTAGSAGSAGAVNNPWAVLCEVPGKTDVRELSEPFLETKSQAVRLRYLGLVAEPRRKGALLTALQTSSIASTPTLIENVARIFAVNASGCPLLLEGAPGIGKTKVIEFVASLMGVECERINFSASTTVEQLVGSVVPTCIDGRRVFAWQDGKLVQALKAKKWILFDEINLAGPEVLEALVPLLDRSNEVYRLPFGASAADDTGGDSAEVPLKDVRVFATMNPQSIGGGRSKLPRSIKNLFNIVKLSPYHDGELRLIVNKLCAPLLTTNDLTQALVDQLFAIHVAVREAVLKRDIGRVGGTSL